MAAAGSSRAPCAMPHARGREPLRIPIVFQVHVVEGLEHGVKLLREHLALRRSLPELRDAELRAGAQEDGALDLAAWQ